MKIRKLSPISHEWNTMEVRITGEEYLQLCNTDLFIEDICPHLSSEEKDFLISGIFPSDWDLISGDNSGV